MTEVQPVQVICDLRNLTQDVTKEEQVQFLWDQLAAKLVRYHLRKGEPLEVVVKEGTIKLWVVENYGLEQVQSNTPFVIIDVLRNPTLLYRCRKCKNYGPFRCIDCLRQENHEGQEQQLEGRERLCSEHAYSITNRMRVYCIEHRPGCACPNPSCPYNANFYCARCHRYFHEHHIVPHPTDKDVEYCDDCYQALFSPCALCPPETKLNSRHLGRLQCYFRTHDMQNTCSTRLCWTHGQQWKIWGPHCRGITLCESHKRELRRLQPIDLLAMMITARPPKQGQSFELTNVFHLRHVLNRDRKVPLTFGQIDQALQALAPYASSWKRTDDRQRFEQIHQAIKGILQEENRLLQAIRAFYGARIGYFAAQEIVSVHIMRNMASASQVARYVIDLQVGDNEKGLFIGHGGYLLKKLCEQLSLDYVNVQ